MRHPTTHKFLAWAGPTSILFLGGCLALVATFAQTYDGVRNWAQKLFDQWWPIVSAGWFLLCAVVVIAAYILALVWTGRDKPGMPMTISPEAFQRESMPPRAFSPSDAWMQKGLEDELKRQSQDRKAKWEADRLKAATPQRDKTLHDGLFYASEGVWPVPEGGLALPSNSERYSEVLDELHQFARDGDITVWARPQRWQNSGVHEPIPREQWGIGAVDFLDTFNEECPMKRRENGYRIFVRLMVSSAEFERQWPHD